MKTKSILAIIAVVMLALAIGQVQAKLVEVPNGDFQTMWKPGSDGAVTATIPDGTYYSIPNMNIKGGGPATYSDGTTGTDVELPGWVIADKDNADIMQGGGWGGPDGDGDCAFLCFSGYGGPTTIVSANPLNVPISAAAIYKLSAQVRAGGGPLVLELLVDGVVLTPETSNIPAIYDDWTEMSNTYSSIPAGDVMKILLGIRDDTGGGWIANRASIDNVTLDVENLMNTIPKDGDTVYATAALLLTWNNLPANDGNDVWVDVWFGTEPNLLHPVTVFNKIVDAYTAGGKNTESALVNVLLEDTYYWKINSYLNGAAHVNEPNMIEGDLMLFYSVLDMAPTLTINTPDKMTWSGKGVPLVATVTNDIITEGTVEWTADLPDGVTASYVPGSSIPVIGDGVVNTTVTLTSTNNEPYLVPVILNGGFEETQVDHPLVDGEYSHSVVGWGWSETDYRETTNPYPPGGDLWGGGLWPVFNGIAPEGQNIAQTGGGGIVQVLTETLAADTTYTLTVKVGRAGFEEQVWDGYRVQLFAGGTPGEGEITEGTLLAEGDGLPTIGLNTFEEVEVILLPNDFDSGLLGEPLQIRLLSGTAVGAEPIYFDDVQLTADPAFTPTWVTPPLAVETVTMTATVTDVGNPTAIPGGIDSIEIDVYADACHMAKVGEGKSSITDFNANCITALEDLAAIAAAWFENYEALGPANR